jgi:6-phosphogluconolactonase/glucosamine-6-phosphate isomerase/deaminase
MEIVSCAEAEDTLPKTVERLNGILAREFGGPVLLLLAGGSSIALYDHIETQHLGSHITLAVTDERATSDAGANNFSRIAATRFFTNACERNCNYIDTRLGADENLDALAARFDGAVRQWFTDHPAGKCLAVLGVGADGHTAGILPHPWDRANFARLFENADRWTVGYDAGGKSEHPLRVTVTCTFLRAKVDEAVVYAVGSAKARALKRLCGRKGHLADLPAWILREMRAATVFTDQGV